MEDKRRFTGIPLRKLALFCLALALLLGALLLLGMSPLSERWKKLICGFVCLFYSYLLVSMICGYTEIVSVYWLGK